MNLSLRETILQLFRATPESFVSGAQISRTLGVSRTAVWKQIEALRDLGYKIEAVRSRGYRLLETPDLLMAEELKAGFEGRRVGRDIRTFEETDSTNIQAVRLAESGAAEGLVVIADQQTAGKGRLGRRWVSPAGVNLYVSILLRPEILPTEAPLLTFLSAVAVCRALEEVGDVQSAVKWPNDILLNGRKMAGLLNEMSSETDRVNYVVLGIGVNLNMKVAQIPSQLRYPATSLAIETGRPVSRLLFARTLLAQVDDLYHDFLHKGPRPVLTAWEAHCEMIGRTVEVDCQEHIIRGEMTGLDDDGALLIRTATGYERILAGDVRPVKQ